MTILIKGMEMPESCAECGLEVLGRCGGNFGALLPANFRGMITRLECCPLVTVPTPHGRLIDARVLQHDMMDMVQSGLYGLEDMVDAVIEAPTVIEAEEANNGR